MTCRRAVVCRLSGNALVECLVSLLALLPLLFAVPVLGKLISLKQTTVLASRFAVWQSTATRAPLAADDLHARFYRDTSIPREPSGSTDGGKALWHAADPHSVASAGRVIVAPVRVRDPQQPGASIVHTFESDDLVQAHIEVPVKLMHGLEIAARQCDRLPGFICLLESAQLLADDWSEGSEP